MSKQKRNNKTYHRGRRGGGDENIEKARA